MFSWSVMSDSLRPHGLQHARPPCPSPTPGVYSNSYSLTRWQHPTISSSVVPFSSCLQSLPALGSFPMSQFFKRGCQSVGVSPSASVLPISVQDWFPCFSLLTFYKKNHTIFQWEISIKYPKIYPNILLYFPDYFLLWSPCSY